MSEPTPDRSVWRRGLVGGLKTIVWPNTLFAVFAALAIADIWLHGTNGPLFDDYLEFLVGIPIIAVFFNLLALNRDDHFLLGCTISLCLVLATFYVVNQKDLFPYHAPLPRVSQAGASAATKVKQHPFPPHNGRQVAPLRGAKGPVALKIINGNRFDAAVKLLHNATPAQTCLFVYVRANSETTVRGIGNGSYILRFALGTRWDGQTHKFLSDQSYFQFTKPLELNQGETRTEVQEVPHVVKLLAPFKSAIDEKVFTGS